jgi:hypothetical protein
VFDVPFGRDPLCGDVATAILNAASELSLTVSVKGAPAARFVSRRSIGAGRFPAPASKSIPCAIAPSGWKNCGKRVCAAGLSRPINNSTF